MTIQALAITDLASLVVEYKETIYVCSALVATIFGLLLMVSRYESFGLGRWVTSLGLAFLVFAVQYGVPATVRIIEGSWSQSYWLSLFVAICSTLNNLLFLAATLSLWGHRLSRSILILLIGCATFAVITASLNIPSLLTDPWFHWVRLPDALVSSVCVGSAGVAIAININFRQKRGVALLSLLVAVIYALVLLIYGLHPILAQTDLVNSFFGDTPEVNLKRMDAIAFAIALPLKFGQFIPAYWLLTEIIKTSDEVMKVFNRISSTRLTYLSGRGIVECIGENLDADKVNLSICIPGRQQRRVAMFIWERGKETDDEARIINLNSGDYEALKHVLYTGETSKQLKNEPYPEERSITIVHSIPTATSIRAPIIFHGAVIGCLLVERERAGTLTNAAEQQVKALASVLTTTAQSYRELASLDQCIYRCARLLTDEKSYNSREAAYQVTSILHDVLSPQATGFIVEIGFQERPILIGSEEYKRLIQQRIDNKTPVKLRSFSFRGMEIYEAPLTETSEQYPAGNFIMVVRPEKDNINDPAMGTFYLHRKAICTIATDAFFAVVRDFLNSKLQDLSVRVSKEEVGIEKWFEGVSRTASDAELQWTVYTSSSQHLDGGDKTKGEQEYIGIIQARVLSQNGEQDAELIKYVPLDPPVGATKGVIRLKLLTASGYLWCGIGRSDFGVELKFDSPWKSFLERFAEIADSSLNRITSAKEFRRLQIEAAQNQALATVAATTGTLVHQLVNMARDQMSATSTLKYAILLKKLHTEDKKLIELISDMKDSGQQLLKLTASLTNVTKVDDHRPCTLREAVSHAHDLFSVSMRQLDINFEDKVSGNLTIDVPFYVAALALANLISNARDAIKHAKSNSPGSHSIRIEAEEEAAAVYCRVIDSGIGIAKYKRKSIFDLGVTTKSNSGGWGLYLVKRSLNENGCRIDLTDSGPGRTTFTIRFPKPKKFQN